MTIMGFKRKGVTIFTERLVVLTFFGPEITCGNPLQRGDTWVAYSTRRFGDVRSYSNVVDGMVRTSAAAQQQSSRFTGPDGIESKLLRVASLEIRR